MPSSLIKAIWIGVYVLTMAAIVWKMFDARATILATLDNPLARSNWEEWREAVRNQSTGAGPVHRRIPKSSEPPALVLMRDYFGVCLTAVVLFVSALYFVTAFLLHGALAPRQPISDRSIEEAEIPLEPLPSSLRPSPQKRPPL